MTHAEALSGPRPAGMPESPCQGYLMLIGHYRDYVMENGAINGHTIDVYHCESCDTRIVLSGVTVQNVYRVAEVGTGKAGA